MRVAGAAGRGVSWGPSCWSRPRRRGRRWCAARGSCWAVLRGTLGLPRYREPVTASWSFDEQPRSGHPLLPDAAAAAIRDALLPGDRQAFETTYQDALEAALRVS